MGVEVVIIVTGYFFRQLYTGFISRKKLQQTFKFRPNKIMKKQLSFALLTLNIFGLNILPVKAIETTNNTLEITEEASNSAIADGKWCVYIPGLQLICWDL